MSYNYNEIDNPVKIVKNRNNIFTYSTWSFETGHEYFSFFKSSDKIISSAGGILKYYNYKVFKKGILFVWVSHTIS